MAPCRSVTSMAQVEIPLDLLEAVHRHLIGQPKQEDDSPGKIARRLRVALDRAVPTLPLREPPR